MDWTPATQQNLKRFFRYGFVSADIAEALASFDAGRPADEVRAFMQERHFDIVGVREEGIVTGYVEADDLTTGMCGDAVRRFDTATVMERDAPLHLTIMVLEHTPHVFVSSLGVVAGIVTPEDVEKPAARLWLFGLVTILEMGFTRLIEQRYPGEEWRDLLPAKRLERAVDLQQERRRHGQERRLAECLHFADKGQILFQNEEVRRMFSFDSRTAARRAVGRVERLRNSLAHAHEIVPDNWAIICRFSAGVDGLLRLVEDRPGEG
jgi:hypothetical protein